MYFNSTWHFQNVATWCLNILIPSQPNNIREKFEFSPKGKCVTPFSRKESATNLKQTMWCFLSYQDLLLVDCKALSNHLT